MVKVIMLLLNFQVPKTSKCCFHNIKLWPKTLVRKDIIWYVCLFVLTVDTLHPSQQFLSHVCMILVILAWTSICTKQRIKCFAQWHNMVPPVSLELATPRS